MPGSKSGMPSSSISFWRRDRGSEKGLPWRSMVSRYSVATIPLPVARACERLAPISTCRCSMPTGQIASQAPQVVHCPSAFSEITLPTTGASSWPRAARPCRMKPRGSSSRPAPCAGHWSVQRRHSTQVRKSMRIFHGVSAIVSRPSDTSSSAAISASSERSSGSRSPRRRVRKKTSTGAITMWKCLELRMSGGKTTMSSACSHQLAFSAGTCACRPHR